MLKNKLICILLLIIILFTFTGCTTATGIDSYYFVISLGIDEADNGLLKISVQIPSTPASSSSSSQSSQSSSYNIYSVEARTIDEGISILNNYLNKKINLSHCTALIISESLAKKGVKTYFLTLSNNTELRHSCKLIISSKSAYDVIEKVSNSGEIFSSRLFDYLTTSSDYTGFTVNSTFGEFFQNLHNNNYQPTAIYTLVSDNIIQTSGIALFKDEYMITNVTPIDSIAHLIATNKLNVATITIDNPFDEKNKVDLEIELYKKTEISLNLINSTPYITLNVYPKGTIRSSGSTFNYINNDNLSKLEHVTDNYLSKIIKNYLYDLSKEYNTDAIGFKGICEAQYLTEEEFEKIHWDEIYKDSFFDVNVKSNINSSNLFNKE